MSSITIRCSAVLGLVLLVSLGMMAVPVSATEEVEGPVRDPNLDKPSPILNPGV